MAKMYYEKNAPLKPLKGKTVAILGYGSQGHAHALNLHDSGVDVVVGLRSGSPSARAAKKEGLKVASPVEACRAGDLIMMLVPDMAQKELYENAVAPSMKKGDALFFAHGFNIHFGRISPPKNVDVCMIAPKAPGHMVRRTYLEGIGTPSLVAVHQDATGRAKKVALAYGRGIGSARAGMIETTFAEETETDLFGEQAVLCGGVTELIRAAFDTLTEAGYQPEVAYFECLHELKLIVDLIHEKGITGMRRSISETAKYGDVMSGPRVVDEKVRETMKTLLEEIRSGAFARDWILENEAGRVQYNARLRQDEDHPIEKVGKRLRSLMKWL